MSVFVDGDGEFDGVTAFGVCDECGEEDELDDGVCEVCWDGVGEWEEDDPFEDGDDDELDELLDEEDAEDDAMMDDEDGLEEHGDLIG